MQIYSCNKNNKVKVLSREEQCLFLQALKGERLENLFQFQLWMGLRPGEVCALRWSDIDWQNGTVTIQSSIRREQKMGRGSQLIISCTKTGRSRTLELSASVLLILKKQQVLQNNEVKGGKYQQPELVFTTKKGTPLEVSSLNRSLRCIQKRMQEFCAEKLSLSTDAVTLPTFTAHSLRHTFATRALEADIPLKVVSNWLGHSTVRVTGDVYSHVSPEMRCASMKRLEQYLTKTFAFSSEKSPETENF